MGTLRPILKGSCVIGKHVGGDNILPAVRAVKIAQPSKGRVTQRSLNGLSEQSASEQRPD